MKLTLGFSPCPNDTFIFDALVNKKIDTGGLDFEVMMEDIETLNKWADEGKLDVTKLSFPAFFPNLHQYVALPSGGALGKGVGPLLVTNNKEFSPVDEDTSQLQLSYDSAIATPGEYTTANFLFSYLFPHLKNKKIPVLFSTIEDSVLSGQAELGLLIHENRFTYASRGLIQLADLGHLFETKTGLPTPLACIAIKRSIDPAVQKLVATLIRKSVEYSFEHYPQISSFVVQHAQAMDKNVMRQHIDLYVNNYSIDLGEDGRKAIELFYSIYRQGQNNHAIPQLFAD